MFTVAQHYCYTVYLKNDKMLRLFCCLSDEEQDALEDFLNSCKEVIRYTFYYQG